MSSQHPTLSAESPRPTRRSAPRSGQFWEHLFRAPMAGRRPAVAILAFSCVFCTAGLGQTGTTTEVTPVTPPTSSDPAPVAPTAMPTPASPPTGSTPAVQGQVAASAAPASVAGVDNAHYVIGADDNLQITVWREPSLSGVLPVRPDGMISLVLIGDLQAAGRTPTQLAGDITLRLKKFLQDPSVTVAVTAVNSQKIFMVGEVGHVGPIVMSPGMTPLQAISAAGGPTAYANLKRIYILRAGTAGAKQQQKIPFNYKQALKGDNKQDIPLQPGDTIVVP